MIKHPVMHHLPLRQFLDQHYIGKEEIVQNKNKDKECDLGAIRIALSCVYTIVPSINMERGRRIVREPSYHNNSQFMFSEN